MARAREEAVQEYKNNFKDTDDYLDMMKDVVDKYKMVVKKIDPNFDAGYYDNLIFPEPMTTASEDLLGSSNWTRLGHKGLRPSKKPH